MCFRTIQQWICPSVVWWQPISVMHFVGLCPTIIFSGEHFVKRRDIIVEIQQWTFVLRSILIRWTFFPASDELLKSKHIGWLVSFLICPIDLKCDWKQLFSTKLPFERTCFVWKRVNCYFGVNLRSKNNSAVNFSARARFTLSWQLTSALKLILRGRIQLHKHNSSLKRKFLASLVHAQQFSFDIF